MTRAPTDIAASVRARLLKLAREQGDDFQLVLTRYLNERLLYRLAATPHGARFILKGAALFTVWTGKPHRATRDVDLLGYGDPDVAAVEQVFADVLAADVPQDGVTFDASTLKVGLIRADQPYGGVRVTVVASVKNAKVALQIDVGFGDIVTPAAKVVEFPALLDFPAPQLRAYPVETVVAEKLDAMVQLGLANSRMKDFYDIVVLSRMFAFDDGLLAQAIRATFERRATPLPTELPLALTPTFANEATKRTQWTAFARKSGASDAGELAAAVRVIAAFVEHPLAVARGAATAGLAWAPGGPWS